VEPTLPPLLGPRFDAAFQLASTLHRAQRRKGSGVAYVSHLLAVAALVLESGGSEDEAIAALLHDAVEDHPERIGIAEIAERFGADVAEMVTDCTDTPPDFAGGPKPEWRPRKEAYIAHIRTAPRALRVSLADKLHNARSILNDHRQVGEAVWSRFSASREETLWYYRQLVDAFREAGADALLFDEFERVVDELHARAAAAPAG
jgi:(p)ppGpp synthase/HD superfamily hydrolase